MAKIDKRFQLLLTEEEVLLLKKEADNRSISQAELLRLALHNEVTKRSEYSRIRALRDLTRLSE